MSAAQLRAAGLSRRAIAHRVATGRLRRVHHGVYLLGPIPGPHCAEWAALLACGPRAALSHATALALCGLGEPPAYVHVTHPATGRRHEGVIRHRAQLAPADLTHRAGLPITAPARTILDVASSMPAWQLARLIEEVQVMRLASRAELDAALARGHGRTGAPALRAALTQEDRPSLTRSEAERRLLALIRAARLPPPATNVRVGRYEVDMLWREQRLVVEVDGFAFHSSRAAFERDRRRDADLQALGYRVVRITWHRIVTEPEAVTAQLAALLASAARPA